MVRTDDPIADFHRHDHKQEEALKKLPRCTYCNEPILDDYLYDVGHGILCEYCMIELCKKSVDDFMDIGG